MGYDYNEISKIYDDVREAEFQLIELMLEKLDIDEKSRVIEIGCGTANYLRVINKVTKAEIWGIDQSQGMLDRAKEKCLGGKFFIDNAEKLSNVPDGSFDLVYMVDVIHHIKDIASMFRNIKRILKPNGMVFVFTDSHEQIKNRLTSKYFPETLEYELGRYQDLPEIIECLRVSSFSEAYSDYIDVGADDNIGPKLIEIASKKGYSMFGPLSEEEINKGVEKLKADIEKGPLVYNQLAAYVVGVN